MFVTPKKSLCRVHSADRPKRHVVPQRKVEQSHVVLSWQDFESALLMEKHDGTKIIQNDELYHDYTIDYTID